MELSSKLYGVVDTKLVMCAIKKWQKRPLSVEQIVLLEDIVGEAIAKYDNSRGMALSSWICYYVPRTFKRYVSDNSWFRHVSLDKPRGNDEDADVSLHDTISSKESTEGSVLAKTTMEAVKAAIAKLDPQGQQFATLLLQNYAEGGSTRCGQDIANELAAQNGRSMSRERVRQIKEKTFATLRKLLADEAELVAC
jgi:DNA-directed RNA polymerase sigma subunit (sigma70/sigma32)